MPVVMTLADDAVGRYDVVAEAEAILLDAVFDEIVGGDRRLRTSTPTAPPAPSPGGDASALRSACVFRGPGVARRMRAGERAPPDGP